MSADQTKTSARVEKLLQSMTPAEKIGQLIQYFYFQLPPDGDDSTLPPGQIQAVEQALASGRAGSLLFVTDPATTNRLQREAIAGNPHGIPLLFGFDVIHGLRTIFPVPIAMAASWSPELIEQAQTVAAREARAVGIHWAFAPMLDIARDPRWGRIIEGAGEDPYLGAAVAAAQVRGFQGPHLGADEHIIAGPKHFAGYGAALGGRDYDEVDLSDQEFWNTYLPPFKAAIDAGAGNVMSAYMDLNGVPATGNRWLLHEVLREALGFEGFVVSDANSARDLETHHYAADLTDAGVKALTAGLDLEMAIHDPAYAHLDEALADGRVDLERIDTSVRRLLNAKEALGLLDNPFVDEQAAQTVLADPAHRDAAREAAESSAVLLRNEGGLLPLTVVPDGSNDVVRSIAVLGQMADSKRDTLGPWIFDYDLDETVTILDGIRSYANGLDTPVEVTYAPGAPSPIRLFPSMFDMWGDGSKTDENFDAQAELLRAVDAATAADVAVVVVGERQDMIGEGASRSSLDLPGEQLALLQAVVATGTPTVVVLMSGRPLDLRWAEENVPSILQVWYPGTRGGDAVANLLFGQAVPGGKLPFSWPRHVGQVPIHYAHTRSHDPVKQDRRYWDEESTPLYPFGHGLSYASFSYSNLTVSAASVGRDESLTVSVDVTNTSGHDGDEVAQLYLHQRYGTSSRPVRLLKGFRRLSLAAGQTERVEFTLGAEERRYWSAATRDWVLDATAFDVWVGGNSNADLHAEFSVTA
ncbi:glycoside hydrolase family 3 N-terminal domain-containing protein [Kineosporia babensis]|uniref:Exo-alpha-(1->6)-L-arabinopyranosidase n=1 Tax=Kineosporia babensis TaxID=499548 RepID=A0A9X1NKZ0_9ACTN|nr:glycoside hydrolase family 3 N-terminal domain-containing protein [Kineosporia babensis]MCD5316088.1 glycoside hydrolase family 3 C-terminal domain-containing protein [Kineosporia babensis]